MRHEGWDLERIARDGRGRRFVDGDLGMVTNVERWSAPITGALRARMLSALVRDGCAQALIDACAAAVSNHLHWEALLRDFLQSTEIGAAAASVAALVLQHHAPAHPLAALRSGSQVTTVYDGIRQEGEVTFRFDGVNPSATQWIVFDPEDILTNVAAIDAHGVMEAPRLSLAALPWLDDGRVVFRPFVVVAQQGI